jgi:hypothetical protein
LVTLATGRCARAPADGVRKACGAAFRDYDAMCACCEGRADHRAEVVGIFHTIE